MNGILISCYFSLKEIKISDSLSTRSLRTNDSDNNDSTNFISDYFKRLSAIKKFVHVYEEVIKRMDKSLQGVAKKLGKLIIKKIYIYKHTTLCKLKNYS